MADVVAGVVLPERRQGVDDGAIGQHRLDPQHEVAARCRSGSRSPRPQFVASSPPSRAEPWEASVRGKIHSSASAVAWMSDRIAPASTVIVPAPRRRRRGWSSCVRSDRMTGAGAGLGPKRGLAADKARAAGRRGMTGVPVSVQKLQDCRDLPGRGGRDQRLRRGPASGRGGLFEIGRRHLAEGGGRQEGRRGAPRVRSVMAGNLGQGWAEGNRARVSPPRCGRGGHGAGGVEHVVAPAPIDLEVALRHALVFEPGLFEHPARGDVFPAGRRPRPG